MVPRESPLVIIVEGRLGLVSAVELGGIVIDGGAAPPAAHAGSSTHALDNPHGLRRRGGCASPSAFIKQGRAQVGGEMSRNEGWENGGEEGGEGESGGGGSGREEAMHGGGGSASVEGVLRSWRAMHVRASGWLIGSLRVGDTVEFDAVYDETREDGLWRATRVVRTGGFETDLRILHLKHYKTDLRTLHLKHYTPETWTLHPKP